MSEVEVVTGKDCFVPPEAGLAMTVTKTDLGVDQVE